MSCAARWTRAGPRAWSTCTCPTSMATTGGRRPKGPGSSCRWRTCSGATGGTRRWTWRGSAGTSPSGSRGRSGHRVPVGQAGHVGLRAGRPGRPGGLFTYRIVHLSNYLIGCRCEQRGGSGAGAGPGVVGTGTVVERIEPGALPGAVGHRVRGGTGLERGGPAGPGAAGGQRGGRVAVRAGAAGPVRGGRGPPRDHVAADQRGGVGGGPGGG